MIEKEAGCKKIFSSEIKGCKKNSFIVKHKGNEYFVNRFGVFSGTKQGFDFIYSDDPRHLGYEEERKVIEKIESNTPFKFRRFDENGCKFDRKGDTVFVKKDAKGKC